MFGPVPNKLLCTWHVDRAWRENLPLVKDKDTHVYHNLRMLMEEPDVHKFETLLTKTKQQLQTLATTSQRLTYRENDSGQDATENDHS